MGRAASIGALLVPQTWAAAAPAISPTSMALPSTSLAVTPAATAAGSGSLLGAPLAGMAGQNQSTASIADNRFMPRLTVVPRSPTVG
ncbi:PE/PPE C-terminal domain-containing protein [Mycobacterium avium]|nr:PE/PPE C-terminal domain-containing protein [Mycobacterium avium]